MLLRTTMGGVTALLLAGSPALSQDPVRRITLDQAVELFARNNFELRIARAAADRAGGQARQAAAYPNPALSWSHESLRDGTADYGETYFTVSQKLDWPWVAAARSRAAGRTGTAGQARVASDSARLLLEVRRAFVLAATAESELESLAEAADLVRLAGRQAADRQAAGDVSGYEVRRIRLEHARYERDLRAAAIALASARRRLGILLLPDSAVPLAPDRIPETGPLTHSVPALLSLAESHPAVLEAEGTLAAARAGKVAAGGERLPSPTLSGGYKTQSDGLGGLFLSAGIPLPLFDRRGAALSAASAELSAAEAQAGLRRRQVENDIRQAHESYLAARSQAELLGPEAQSDATALLSVARLGYQEGEMSLVELLDAVSAYRVARTTAAEAAANLSITYFELERAVGRPLATLPGGNP